MLGNDKHQLPTDKYAHSNQSRRATYHTIVDEMLGAVFSNQSATK
jgi:hypothetical protein